MLEGFNIGHLALVLETSRAIFVPSRNVFWRLEVTFFSSRAIGERCRREFENSFLLFPLESFQVSHACVKSSGDGRFLTPYL